MKVDRVLGGAALALAVPVGVTSWGYGIGTLRSPGPGSWTLLVAAAIAALGVELVLRPDPGFRAPAAADSRWRSLAIAVVTLVLFVAALEPLGYPLAMAALLLVQFRWVEGEPWRTTLVATALATLASFVVFRGLLGVPLPAGVVPLPRGW